MEQLARGTLIECTGVAGKPNPQKPGQEPYVRVYWNSVAQDPAAIIAMRQRLEQEGVPNTSDNSQQGGQQGFQNQYQQQPMPQQMQPQPGQFQSQQPMQPGQMQYVQQPAPQQVGQIQPQQGGVPQGGFLANVPTNGNPQGGNQGGNQGGGW